MGFLTKTNINILANRTPFLNTIALVLFILSFAPDVSNPVLYLSNVLYIWNFARKMFTTSTYWHNLISRLNNPLTICIPFTSLLFLIIYKRDAAWTINNNADIASPCLLPLYNGKYSQIVPFVMHSMLIWTQFGSNLRIDHQNWISNAILSNTFIITHFQ